ncbi:MAG: FecR domain-containing protein [Anaerolineales bacterium]
MRRNPERLAWAILIAAFATFCFLIVAVPLGIRWHLHNAQVVNKARVESLAGTIVVEELAGSGPMPLAKGNGMEAKEGSTIYADEASQALITFADDSYVQLYPGTTVRLDEMRAPRYQAGIKPVIVHMTLLEGRLRLGSAVVPERETDMTITSPTAHVRLSEDGSFLLEATSEASEVAVYRGYAVVTAQNVSVVVEERQRTTVQAGETPGAVVGVARNLVRNSNLRPPLDEWYVYNEQGTDGGVLGGQADAVVDAGVSAVRLWRSGGQGNHCETVLEQNIDATLSEPITSLVMRMTFKIRYQQLSGGGYLASEYPLMVRLTYRDEYDSEAEWVQGFYYQNDDGNPTTYGMQVPRDRWYVYESENLLETLPVKPVRIVKIRVYASGWDYDSLVSDINLIVE